MAQPGNIIRFLRLCYESDNRETAISNLFSDRVRHLLFLHKASEFLQGNIDLIPADRDAALAARKSAMLHLTERTLVFCTLMLAGKINRPEEKPVEICAPLLFFPASVREDERFAYLEVDSRQQRLNRRLLQSLGADGPRDDESLDLLLQNLPSLPFNHETIDSLAEAVREGWPGIDPGPLRRFPLASGEAEVREFLRRKSPGLALFNASAMALIPNSPDTRGVLFELDQLAESGLASPPLEALLASRRKSKSPPANPEAIWDRTLSRAQQQALESASRNPLTLAIGPPGTGKSYTLAALALDHAARGESVLIACRNNKAIDVLVSKIKELAGNTDGIVRGGREGHTAELIQRLSRLLQGIHDSEINEPAGRAAVRKCRDALDQEAAALRALEGSLHARAKDEINWGRLRTEQTQSGIFGRLIARARLGALDRKLKSQPSYWKQIGAYHRRLELHHRQIARCLQLTLRQKVEEVLSRRRRQLQTLLKALRARTNLKQEQLFGQINRDVLLGCFPIWIAPLNDLSQFVPFRGGVFDLVIVDEATQCDMASCLPAFFRGKRAVISGDPRQLRHVSFASRQQMQELGRRFGLTTDEIDAYNYREKSILDLMNERIDSQHQVVFLNEHFRSRPQIIAFSNATFYAGHIRVMTANPAEEQVQSVFLHQTPGHRSESGANTAEAGALVEAIAGIVDAERDLSAGVCHSVGVLSPFRDQVDLLAEMLARRFETHVLEKHEMLTGTAHAFQGEERDMMFLSLAVDDDSHSASFRFLNRPDVFNVSITRARIGQHIYYSFDPRRLAPSLLASYFESILNAPPARMETCDLQDEFRDDVIRELKQRGAQVRPSFPIAGMRLDLMAVKDGRAIGINLIGHPGPFRDACDLERHRMFRRAGLKLFSLPWSAWFRHRERAVQAIIDALEEGSDQNEARW